MKRTSLFSIYSDYDTKLIKYANKLGYYLIGGTALEIYINKYNIKSSRVRSRNDIDFLEIPEVRVNRLKLINYVSKLDSNKLKVDILETELDLSNDLFLDIDGIKVMSPIYLIYSKIRRMTITRKHEQRYKLDKKDFKDLVTIIDTMDLDDSFLQDTFTELEMNLFNSLL